MGPSNAQTMMECDTKKLLERDRPRLCKVRDSWSEREVDINDTYAHFRSFKMGDSGLRLGIGI